MGGAYIDDDGWVVEPAPPVIMDLDSEDPEPEPEENKKQEVEKGQNTVNGRKIKKALADDDIVIAIMGMTGAGKSSFISLLTEENVEVGHDLASCTSEPEVYTYTNNGRTIHLIDTPGFDDTTRSDIDILKDIALLFSTIYARKVRLAGVIYLHRIIDLRMTGSAFKNLQMLEKFWGGGSTKQLVLATTMWGLLRDKGNEQEGLDREEQLKEKFWKHLQQRGTNIVQHTGNAESAKSIVSYLLDQNSSVVLDIQRQMVDERLDLDQTSAGLFLQKDLLEARSRLEKEIADCQRDLEEAMAEKDKEQVAELAKQQEQNKAKLEKSATEQVQLKLNFQGLTQEKDHQYTDLAREIEQEKQARTNEIRFIEQNVATLQDTLERQQREHREQIMRISKSQKARAAEDADRLNQEWTRVQQQLFEQIQAQQAELQRQQVELRAIKRKKSKKGVRAGFESFIRMITLQSSDESSDDEDRYGDYHGQKKSHEKIVIRISNDGSTVYVQYSFF